MKWTRQSGIEGLNPFGVMRIMGRLVWCPNSWLFLDQSLVCDWWNIQFFINFSLGYFQMGSLERVGKHGFSFPKHLTISTLVVFTKPLTVSCYMSDIFTFRKGTAQLMYSNIFKFMHNKIAQIILFYFIGLSDLILVDAIYFFFQQLK